MKSCMATIEHLRNQLNQLDEEITEELAKFDRIHQMVYDSIAKGGDVHLTLDLYDVDVVIDGPDLAAKLEDRFGDALKDG